MYKDTFWVCWRSDKNVERRFDFPKFHMMLHYFDHICKFGTTDDYNTAHYKVNHKFILKKFYEKTNKHETFQKQLLWYNKRCIKALAMKNIVASLYTRQYMKSTEMLIDKDLLKATNTWIFWVEISWHYGPNAQGKKHIDYKARFTILVYGGQLGICNEYARADSGVGCICQKTILDGR